MSEADRRLAGKTHRSSATHVLTNEKSREGLESMSIKCITNEHALRADGQSPAPVTLPIQMTRVWKHSCTIHFQCVGYMWTSAACVYVPVIIIWIYAALAYTEPVNLFSLQLSTINNIPN